MGVRAMVQSIQPNRHNDGKREARDRAFPVKLLLEIELEVMQKIAERLQALEIRFRWLASGVLEIDVRDWLAAVQVRSVLHQFCAPRPLLVGWLEFCWQLSPLD